MDIDKIIEADGNIYRSYFPIIDITMSYRLLSLKEYKVFKNLRDAGILPFFHLAEAVFERCYLGNSSLISNEIPAGLTISIGGLIMYLSGDCDGETLQDDIAVQRQMNPADTVFEYMRSAIITAFPTYTLEHLDSLTRVEFIKYFTIAENILGKQNQEYQRLDLSKIQDAATASKSKEHNIDFARENAQIRTATGHWGAEEAEQQYRRENKSTTLSKEQLQKLSASRGR